MLLLRRLCRAVVVLLVAAGLVPTGAPAVAANAASASASAQLAQLQRQLTQLGAERNQQTQALTAVNAQLVETSSELAAARHRLDAAKQLLARQATDLYIHGVDYVDADLSELFSAGNGDSSLGAAYMAQLQGRAKATAGDLRAVEEDLAITQKQLAQQQSSRQKTISALDARQTAMEEAIGAQQSIVAQYAAVLPPALVASIPRGAAVGVPGNLHSYGNGRLPDSVLESIGVGNHRLWPPAAEAFKRLLAASRAAGVSIGVTDSYRSYAEQVKLAHTKGLYGRGGLAAVPGTSNHGWGLAVDLALDGASSRWMHANASRFCFANDVPGESWHWDYRCA